VVTPKSVLIYLEISGFPYKSTSHSLAFTMGILSASDTTVMQTSDVPSHVRQVVSHGTRANFIDLPTVALVDDVIQPVALETDTAPTDNELGNWKLTSIIRPYLQKGGLVINSRTVKVNFPVGANDITWQPNFGFGEGPILPDPPAPAEAPPSIEEEEAIAQEEAAAQVQEAITVTTSVIGALVGFAAIALIATFAFVKYRHKQYHLLKSDAPHRPTNSEDVNITVVDGNESKIQAYGLIPQSI